MAVCIQCGNYCPSLHKTYSKGIIELTKCKQCDEFVDKYIEYEASIIFIDILLLRLPAYRHVLHNSDQLNTKWIFRVLILSVLSNAFHRWSVQHEPSQAIDAATEVRFYIEIATSLICTVAYVSALSILVWKTQSTLAPSHFRSMMDVVRCMSLSNFCLLFLMPVHVWVPDSSRECYILVRVYQFLVTQRAAKALTGANDIKLAAGCAMVAAVEALIQAVL